MHTFPSNVVGRQKSSFLNDIAIADGIAYISDSKKGQLVVYDAKTDTSWSIKQAATLADNIKV